MEPEAGALENLPDRPTLDEAESGPKAVVDESVAANTTLLARSPPFWRRFWPTTVSRRLKRSS
jgi:hypothetical protein